MGFMKRTDLCGMIGVYWDYKPQAVTTGDTATASTPTVPVVST